LAPPALPAKLYVSPWKSEETPVASSPKASSPEASSPTSTRWAPASEFTSPLSNTGNSSSSPLVQLGDIYTSTSVPGAHARSLLRGYPGGATGNSPGLSWIPAAEPVSVASGEVTFVRGILRCQQCATWLATQITKKHRAEPVHRAAVVALSHMTNVLHIDPQARNALDREYRDMGQPVQDT
jgi:hypothetical protein